MSTEFSRRAAVGIACAAVCAGCTRYGPPGAETPTPQAEPGTPQTGTPQADTPQVDAARMLGRVADVPVGGGKVFREQEIVVTQPVAGEFAAFSAVCTHQGCVVGRVDDGAIHCDCHGSAFGLDGAVLTGPASAPLPTRAVKVTGDQISLA